MTAVSTEIRALLDGLAPVLPRSLMGLYLCGSAARGNPGPHSDVDFLGVVEHSLSAHQRHDLTAALLELSGWSGHAESFPDAAHRRPVEFTAVVGDDVAAWDDPPQMDYQYGEWLRAELVTATASGEAPEPLQNPDLVLFLADARQHYIALDIPSSQSTALGDSEEQEQTLDICPPRWADNSPAGSVNHAHATSRSSPPLEELLASPPQQLVAQACQDALPELLGELSASEKSSEAIGQDDGPGELSKVHGDERNVLLTLARMVVTVQTGRIVSKPEAAEQVMRQLTSTEADVLEAAAEEYRGQRIVDWADRGHELEATLKRLARGVRSGIIEA